MKHILRLWPTTFLMVAGIVVLSSCVHQERNPAPAKAPSEVATPAPVTNSTPPAAESPAPRHYKKFADIPFEPFPGDGWQDLLDGNSLTGWAVVNFAGHGEVEVESGAIVLPMGDPFTGVSYTNSFPKVNYEIALEAMRVMGTDFFCGLTVPVRDSHCSLILGGWGGSLVGISSLDSMDASENETTKFKQFENGKWHRIRLRVTEKKIEGWIGDEKLVDVSIEGRKIALRPGEIERCAPLGIAAWQTTAMVREIKYRRVEGPETPPKKQDY
jgi:hypothetical protein